MAQAMASQARATGSAWKLPPLTILPSGFPLRSSPPSSANKSGLSVTAFASRSSTPAAWRNWGLQAGARADLLLLNPLDTALRGLADSHLLDGVVFASPEPPPARTLVAGCWAIPDTTALAKRAAQALAELAQGGETAA